LLEGPKKETNRKKNNLFSYVAYNEKKWSRSHIGVEKNHVRMVPKFNMMRDIKTHAWPGKEVLQ